MAHIPLDKFFEDRLAKTPVISCTPLEMGVTVDRGRIGGFVTGSFRKAETFSDIEARRKKVTNLLQKYAA